MAAAILAAGAGAGQGQPELVAQVESGALQEARASWWGFDPADATEALQAAINSGVPRLVVDDPGQPWIVRPIRLASNQEVLFEPGVVVEAKRGEFKGRGDCLFTAAIAENIVLRGPGATLRMRRDEYDNPELYERSEWRHVLSIRSSKNIQVHGLTLALSGGDGIYLGVSKPGVPNQDIVIKDVVCDRNYRQGISVISARRLLIENTIMRGTGGTPPAAGIDFEPNAPSEELVDCVMRNCVAEDNEGDAYTFYLPNLHADSAPLSIRLENCIARQGNRNDFGFTTANSEKNAVQGHVDAVGCSFSGSRSNAIHIRSKPVTGAAIRFSGCTVEGPAADDASVVPILIQSRVGDRRAVGGVDFGDLVVCDPVERPFLDYEDWSGASAVAGLSGTLSLRSGAAETEQRLTPEWLAEAFPAREQEDIPPLPLAGATLVPADVTGPDPAAPGETFYLRKTGALVCVARAGDAVSATLSHARVGKYAGRPMHVTAVSPSGAEIAAGEVPVAEEAEVSFTAPEAGLYRLPLSAGPNRFGVVDSSHPMAVSGEDSAIRFIGPAGDLYFLVPAGTERFGLLIYGEGAGEAVAATVYDPAGNLVWERDPITLPVMCAPDVAAAPRDEAWRLRLSPPTGIVCEDYFVDLRGIPPFLARDPRALLTVQR